MEWGRNLWVMQKSLMVKIHQEIYGQGEAIVLIHGWAMHTGIWRTFAQQLAQHYQVICLDIPGHGGSDTVEPYSLEKISEVLIEVVRPPSFCVLGWSLGASIALTMANMFPQRIHSFICLAGNPKFVQTQNWHGMPMPLLQEFAINLQLNCQLSLLHFLTLQTHGLPNQKSLLNTLKQAIYERPPPTTTTLNKGLQILKNADLRENLSALKCALMIIQGDKDKIVPVQTSQDMQKIQANNELIIISGGGHVPFLSHSALLIKKISGFV